MHNLRSCSPELKAVIDAHAARLDGWGVARHTLEQAVEAAVIVASLTEDSLLAAALLAQPALDAAPDDSAEIEQHFGPGVITLARELRHFGDIRLTPMAAASRELEPAQAEALRKMLLSVVSDPRLVLARLARQLVELTAAKDGHAATRERLALETREVFAPLANRLGLWQLKWELEDLAFRYLRPDDYRRIASALAEKRTDRERYITEFCRTLESMVRAVGIEAEIQGRPKHIYSIHRKMERKQLTFEQVFDLRAVRIITKTVADCYAVLGIVHGNFTYIPGEFDDYIATPKDNFYRSIHTAVIGPEGKAVEVQIRTREMHEQADLGLAAHWRYKESRAHDVSYDRKIEWVRKLLEPTHAEGTDKDFLDSVRSELFEDRIYALTPKGEVVDLPHGATPLDFAYHVHTDLGHRCRGARVNGRIVPLTRPLANGEIVEIITHKHPQPSRDWLSETQGFLVSPRSRSKVRAWFRKLDEEAAKLAPPTAAAAPPPAPASAPPRKKVKTRRSSRSPVVLAGVEDLPTSFARCCAPVKPEPIAGYTTVGRGVTIHRANCPGLQRMSAAHPDRLIAASWADASTTQPVTLTIVAIDRQGLVRDVGDLLASEKISIEMMHTTTDRTQSTATIDLRVGVDDAPHLTRLLQRIRKVASVLSVRRTA